MMNQKTKGFVMGAIAAATYGMNPLFALPLYAEGMQANDVLLWRYGLALMILLVMIKWRGQCMRVPIRQLATLAGLGLLFGLSSLCLFESYNYMAAGIASTMLFVYPLMVALIMTAVFREKLSWLTAVCLVMATGGIALLYKGENGSTLSAVGTMLVMLSALSYAVYLVWVNRPALQQIPTLVLTFYVLLSGLVIFVVPLSTHTLQMPASVVGWGCVVALGLLPTAVSLVCTTIAIQNIGSTPTAILGALEPLTAIFFGLLLFGETLTLRIAVGLALILVAVTLVIAGDNISVALLRMRKMFPAVYHHIISHRGHHS